MARIRWPHCILAEFRRLIDTAFSISFGDTSNTSRNLAFQADAGNASINIASGSTGLITIGNGGISTSQGTFVLNSNLDIAHDGSGILLFNRPTTGDSSNGLTRRDITKTGTGTWQVDNNINSPGSININVGTMVANTSGAGDLNSATALNLGGGTVEIRSRSSNKDYSTVGLTVNTGSTLAWNNTNATTNYTLTVSGAGSFALNDDLTIRNISSNATLVNGINISRVITGTGDMIVDTYNNISSGADVYGLGRVFLTGDNSAWSGNLVIARGTASLGGNGVNAAGTGTITLGTTADASGAGLTFFPGGANGSTVTYNNKITVRSGGFRSIKGSGTDHNFTFAGDVALEGDLNIDHSLATGRRMRFDGDISGAGGVAITRAAGGADSGVLLNGVNTYLGPTTVGSGAALGGDGQILGDITFAAGANYIFNTTATLDVGGDVNFDGFAVTNLIGLDVNTVAGTYMLLNGFLGSNINQTNVSNIGLANAFDLGDGYLAYFDFGGGDLSVVVGAIPEPSSFALVGGFAALGLVGLRRRRTA